MNLRIVTDHYCLYGESMDQYPDVKPHPRLPKSAQWWWRHWALREVADVAAVATHQRTLVGFVRIITPGSPHYASAAGTWVEPKYRRQGLGVQMWSCLLRRFAWSTVEVITTTKGGYRLVCAVGDRHPEIDWVRG